ncbi:hypothetical protein CONPUDRAFT_75422 [Coniophora puteana RWD-64-598 SS2]|uniref:Uncharacterized protein n=1 Tax=Coniophora puteana (strain RWD-64-598) TaxID=741705 RepID=A0A5M3MEU8_CONPW|nr:uncharacterized protein CONPUDRAFT_75422 [Coniophora puteana RWD-64-598 SS2]EIW77567.1 hypothetical protein CONPUDRAFT_75422 [Coniophora puteana RWD-64-598 SS2]
MPSTSRRTRHEASAYKPSGPSRNPTNYAQDRYTRSKKVQEASASGSSDPRKPECEDDSDVQIEQLTNSITRTLSLSLKGKAAYESCYELTSGVASTGPEVESEELQEANAASGDSKAKAEELKAVLQPAPRVKRDDVGLI